MHPSLFKDPLINLPTVATKSQAPHKTRPKLVKNLLIRAIQSHSLPQLTRLYISLYTQRCKMQKPKRTRTQRAPFAALSFKGINDSRCVACETVYTYVYICIYAMHFQMCAFASFRWICTSDSLAWLFSTSAREREREGRGDCVGIME